jgi:hypothetical protein
LFPAVTYAQGSDPWCLVRDEAEICGYQTKEACYAKAQYGGFCRQNTRFMGVSGERRWCVVTDTRRNCAYSRNMCLKVAQEVGGGCVENTELALKKSRIGVLILTGP